MQVEQHVLSQTLPKKRRQSKDEASFEFILTETLQCSAIATISKILLERAGAFILPAPKIL
ncbi:hypothetical protein CX676_14025 [Paracoccus zhejiangensis]|uniref:Uncharacterized protein n=1 Tax=Paracoccus zhejiangensis TaxID=1077935 RepID=A0A2H5F0U6_9RHOB|nr:hypothetical protein CX676_14025 [Paracoccus zhejiangensis]